MSITQDSIQVVSDPDLQQHGVKSKWIQNFHFRKKVSTIKGSWSKQMCSHIRSRCSKATELASLPLSCWTFTPGAQEEYYWIRLTRNFLVYWPDTFLSPLRVFSVFFLAKALLGGDS